MKNKYFRVLLIIFLLTSFLSTNLITVKISAGYIDIYNIEPTTYSYYEGDYITVNWNYFEAGNYVKIELYRNNQFYTTLNSNTTNDGSFSWTIPAGFKSNYNYWFKIISIDDPYTYDTSPSFDIDKRYIEIISPSSGETFYTGESKTISWNSYKAGNYVEIKYLKGSNEYTIDSNAYNDGEYQWTIPTSLTPNSNYRIKIISNSYTHISDTTDYFNIGERTLTVTAPESENIWYKNEKNTIKWDSAHAGSYLKIDLYKESSYYTTIDTYAYNSGSYNWTIPSSIDYATNYRIKITSKTYTSLSDFSEYFTIDERYIINYFPSSNNNQFLSNETVEITWSSKNIGENVEIRLTKDSVHTAWITKNTINDGNYTWKISDSYLSSDKYQIEIRSHEYKNVFDVSDYFSIGSRSLTIIKPQKNDQFIKGEYIEIIWESENIGDYVDIHLYKDGSWVKTIASNIDNTGMFNWEIPSDFETGSDYQIKISSPLYSEVSAFSEGEFSIDESLFQKVSTPLILIIAVIIIIIVLGIIVKKIYVKRTEKLKESKNTSTTIYHETTADTVKIKPNEYDDIWEKNKPK